MRYVDPHLHTHMIRDGAMVNLAMSGMEAVVIPMPHCFMGTFTSDTVFQLWERFLGFEIKRGSAVGYEAFVSLGIPMYGLDSAAIADCLKRLPEFLDHERVVAMGEIGLDNGSDSEKQLFRDQLQIAKAHDLPVIVHTPIRLAVHAPEMIRTIVDIIREEKFDMSKVVLDHAGESTFDFRKGTEAMIGLSVCSDKMPPEVAAGFVKNNPDLRKRLLVNTEVAGGDGYFTIPRVTLAMRQMGMKHNEIEEVVYENPKNFFNLPIE